MIWVYTKHAKDRAIECCNGLTEEGLHRQIVHRWARTPFWSVVEDEKRVRLPGGGTYAGLRARIADEVAAADFSGLWDAVREGLQ